MLFFRIYNVFITLKQSLYESNLSKYQFDLSSTHFKQNTANFQGFSFPLFSLYLCNKEKLLNPPKES